MTIKLGLEIHVSLSTKTKLFCACKNDSSSPNTLLCPVCAGHPGARLSVNKEAVVQALALASALECELCETLLFARKTYFYPDLPRNYQITQLENPVGSSGVLRLEDGSQIRIRRVQLEEDPGSLSYEGALTTATHSLIDYNRAGTPLVEIVTEPDFTSPAQVRAFMKELSLVLSYLGVREDDARIKADANVSIEESGFVRVEIKNITGFKSIEQAIKRELVRQKLLVKKGSSIVQQTRGWDGAATYLLREKEEENDYGYIVEPNVPLIAISQELLLDAKKRIPELPQQRIQRYCDAFGIDYEDAKVLVQDKELALVFEELAKSVSAPLAARWVREQVARVLHYTKKSFSESPLTIEHVVAVLALLEKESITEQTAKKLMEDLSVQAFDVSARVESDGLSVLSQGDELQGICEQVISENKKAFEDYLSGEEKALNFLIGQVMRITRSRASPDVVRTAFETLVNDR